MLQRVFRMPSDIPVDWHATAVVAVVLCCGVHHTIPTDSVPTDAIPTVHAHCTVWTSGGWLQLTRPTGSTDWIDAEPNPENQRQYNCVEVCCNFPGGWGTPDPLGYSPQALLPSVTSVPRSMPCLWCIQRLDPFQFLPNFYYFYNAKRARDVLGRPDCRLSE